MMDFLRRRRDKNQPPESEEVFLSPLGPDSVVAFGPKNAIDALGETTGTIAGPLTKILRTTVGSGNAIADTANHASGAVLRLTPESQALLKQYPQMQSGGASLGVVVGPDGKIVGQLKFLNTGSAIASTVPALMGGLALQQQLMVIDQKLDRLQVSIDYLTTLAHIEVAAELAAIGTILEDTYAQLMRDGEITEDQWATAADMQKDLLTLHNRAAAHMELIAQALAEPDTSIRSRKERLDTAINELHAPVWLRVSVLAERAMRHYELIELIRTIEMIPDQADTELRAKAEATSRRQALAQESIDSIAGFVFDVPKGNFIERHLPLTRRGHDNLANDLATTISQYLEPGQLAAFAPRDDVEVDSVLASGRDALE